LVISAWHNIETGKAGGSMGAAKMLVGAKICAMIILTIALLPLPYSFYTLLRWLVFPVFVISLYRAGEYEDSAPWTWVFVYLALIFNPFYEAPLGRGFWIFFDIVAVVLLGLSLRSTLAEGQSSEQLQELIKKSSSRAETISDNGDIPLQELDKKSSSRAETINDADDIPF
jgi:hypothetical protein